MGYNKHMHKDQRGIISIITVMFLAIVLAITTTSFLRLMLRSNRQVVDSTLSSQAYYAAETGVEDAIQAIKDNAIIPASDVDCGATPVDGGDQSDLGNGTAYSCQLIDGMPTLLNKTLKEYESWLVNIEGYDSSGATKTDVTEIDIEWSQLPSDQPLVNSRGAGLPDLQPDASWKSNFWMPALRVQAMFAPKSGVLNRSNFTEHTSFIVPKNGGVSDSIDTLIVNNSLKDALCSGSPVICRTTITVPQDTTTLDTKLLIKSLYRGSDVKITLKDGSGDTLRAANAQARIDVTGRAGDVFRRIEVYVSTSDSMNSDFSLQSGEDICKLLTTRPGNTTDSC